MNLHRADARLPLPSAITRLCVNERDPFKKKSLPPSRPLRIPIDPAAAASMSMNGRRMLDEREGLDCGNFPIRYEAPSSHAAATMAPLARKDPRSLARLFHPPDHSTYMARGSNRVPVLGFLKPAWISKISLKCYFVDLIWMAVITPESPSNSLNP